MLPEIRGSEASVNEQHFRKGSDGGEGESPCRCLREECSGRANSKCKGPESGACLVSLNTRM